MSAPDEKIRLGGMALANGVLVHGPTSWACAIRTSDGRIEVAADKKRSRSSSIEQPLLRGPARLLEAVAILPRVKRALPEARFAFESKPVLASMLATAAAVQVVKGAPGLRPVAKELAAGLLSLVPATLALRDSELAAYHGAEHVAIGTYEHGEQRGKEHERCGSHLVGPLLVTSAIGGALAARAPAHLRRGAKVFAGLGALAASTEIFAWMVRNPKHAIARALARPGHELQHRIATAEPTPEQVEVAEAALRACLELESDGAQHQNGR